MGCKGRVRGGRRQEEGREGVWVSMELAVLVVELEEAGVERSWWFLTGSRHAYTESSPLH